MSLVTLREGGPITMRKFPFPRIHGPDYDLCIRSMAACNCFENILDKSSYCAKSMAIKPFNGTFNDTYVLVYITLINMK